MNKKLVKWALTSSVVAATAAAVGVVPTFAASNPPVTIVGNLESSWQDNFSPYLANNVQFPLGTIYESLFYFSTTGPQYNMLGSDYQWSNGNKTLTVTLRSGVKWNDGSALTAQDVIYSYQILKKNPSLDLQQIWSEISSVKAIGSSKIQFQFKAVDVPFAQILLSQVAIVPEKIWSKQKDPSKWTDPSPVGSGPYMLDKFTPQNYSLKANPYYWGGKPAVPELNYPALAGNDSADLQLSAGKLDWTGLFIPQIDKLYVSKDPAHNNYFFPDNGVVAVYPNLRDPILGDLQVRKAMSLAIDRNKIYKIGEYGYEPPASPSGLSPSQQQWLGKGVPANYPATDVKQANAILDKAGYPMGANGYRTKNGKELDFNLIAPAGWTDWNEDESLVATALKQIGIKVSVQQPQQADWQSQLTNHTFQLALESGFVATGNTPYYGYYNVLAPKGWENYEGYNNSATTKALVSFKGSSNLAQEKAAMSTIEQSVAANLPIIPLVGAASWYEYSTKNYTGWPSAKDNYVDAPPYSSYATGIVLMHLKPAK